MRFRLGLLGCSALVLGLVSAWQAIAAPLADEIFSLVANHPQIKSNQAQVSAAEKLVRASLAPYLPTVELTGDTGADKNSTPAFRATPSGPFTRQASQAGITVKENIFDGGIKSANREQAKIQLDSASVSLINTRQAVIAEGMIAYLNVLRQIELMGLSTKNEENIRKQLNLEDERVKRGAGIAVDVLQAKSRLQLSLERLTAVRGALEDAKSRYLQVFNRGPETEAMARPAPPLNLLPRTVEEAITIALDESPAVLGAAKQIDLAMQRRDAIEGEYFPRIDLVGESKYENNFNGLPGIKRDTSLKVKGTWSLFSGLGTQSRSQGAAFDYEARMADLLQTKRKTEEQVRISWNALKTAQEREALLENAVNIAGEVFESRKKLRQSGKETVINVLDAESEVFGAQINYTSVSYDARISAYEVLRAIGRLDVNAVSAK